MAKVEETEAENSRGSPTGTQTLERGLDLLELVAREPMRTTDLVKRSGLSRSTAMRLVHCLVERGFLTLGGESQLRPGPTLLQLGACAQASSDLLTVARPHLETLSARTGLPTFLGRRDGDFSVHLHRTAGAQRVMVVTPVGTRRRLAETSLGKVLLLDESEATRQRLLKEADPGSVSPDWEDSLRRGAARGVILHEGPPPDSIRAIAAPVRDVSGKIVAAISVATVAQYIDTAGMEALAPEVVATANAISLELGWQGIKPEPRAGRS